ncbi:MAG: hypothetical protein EA379_11980 [Phycisphaerales bacterium]|nr:MAG: hypothetical protein EA379_11980 [Phycisphaerales bacterium]
MRRGTVIRIGVVLASMCVSAYFMPTTLERVLGAPGSPVPGAPGSPTGGVFQGLLGGPAPAAAGEPEDDLVIYGADHLSPEERARLLEEARRNLERPPAQRETGDNRPQRPGAAPAATPEGLDAERAKRLEDELRRLLDAQRSPR